MNVELSSIYLGIWPHYIGNPHTNEHDLSAGIDRLSRADFGMPAEPRLATLSTACNCTPPPGWLKSIFATLLLIQLLLKHLNAYTAASSSSPWLTNLKSQISNLKLQVSNHR